MQGGIQVTKASVAEVIRWNIKNMASVATVYHTLKSSFNITSNHCWSYKSGTHQDSIKESFSFVH